MISKRVYGGYVFDELVIGISDLTEYTPINVNIESGRTIVEAGEEFLFFKPELRVTGYVRNGSLKRYSDFFRRFLNSSVELVKFRFTYAGTHVFVYVQRGMILSEDGEILILFATKEKYKSTDVDYDINKLRLFVSTNLFKHKKYSTFYKKIKESIIDRAFSLDIPVEYISSKKIEDTIYVNDFKIKGKSLNEIDNYLKNEYINEINEVWE